MGTLTVRPQPEHEDALAAVGALLQEKRASQTLLKSLMAYEPHCKEIAQLKAALHKAEKERDMYKDKIERFKAAQLALFE
ncbi:TPA: hypothetical protein OT801_003752 [Morganella morganii]|uniref:Uncharacterized protein n=2 Tax=Enterobacterales TaxID=91347 RepID=A0A142EC37_ECOLX|nr:MULTISPECIES: hypothetical protein [Enterobacterales]ECM0800565.1 hypothetical protein [Salmonella enterica subsp. enterica serovar Enteritidis]EFP7242567.1 hypothetical protein [Shigella flexneri]EJR0218716.1 hypothetical protein [Klebsiella pneumoniae]EKU4289588.1 hypothetical protein [Morganella morganii]MJC96381.1 hypothetical protein [Salmonella enterica subsp. enterica serovar Infantis]CAF2614062.1 hypothetical protein AI2866V1_4616 [Enterobacter cloacae]HBC0578954.1 hypothetical pr